MKTILISVLLAFLGLFMISSTTQAGPEKKKTKTITVKRTIPVSAAKLWNAVATDYGLIGNSHPGIYYSGYIAGTHKGELGAARRCDFNKKGTKVLHEKIIEWDESNMTYTNSIIEASGLPIDPALTKGYYKVIAIDNNHSEIQITIELATKPAFMAGMAKGKFQKTIGDYLIAVEHHLRTGEIVNATTGNFKDIKKEYR